MLLGSKHQENICIDMGQTRPMIYHGDHGWTLKP